MSDNSVLALSAEFQPSKALNITLWILQALAMVGAVATHLFIIGGSPVPAVVLLLITSIVAWYRRPASLRASQS